MPKYTVQNGTVVVPKDPKNPAGDRDRLKVGDELELTPAQAKKMDPEGFYLCLSSKYSKAKKEEPDDAELEKLTKPDGDKGGGKPPAK